MRIVQVVSSIESEAAGPSYSVPHLARALADAGNDCSLLSLGTSGCDNTLGVRHKRCSRSLSRISPLRKLGMSSEMKRAIVKLGSEVDIIHSHGLWRMPNVYPASAARLRQASFVLSPRGMLSQSALKYSVWSKWLFWALVQKRALASVAMFHATSEQEYEDIRRAGLRQPVAILRNGITLPAQTGVRAKADGKLRTILYLGRLHPIKSIDTLVEAWAELENQFNDWRLIVCGPGDQAYRDELVALSRSLQVKRCEFRNAVFGQDKIRAFTEASLFVLPSASENFAMTVAESLACGTPVIASHGSPWSGLRDHECGWWIEHGKEALCQALREAMMLSDDKLVSMGKSGRDWMRREFSWGEVGHEMTRAYSWLRNGRDMPSFIRL